MTYVERQLLLRNGPPWGFRLYEDFMEGLIVSKIRHRSPAEMAGMLEGDHVLAINGFDALDMSHSSAVQIIDSAAYTLEIYVGRYERQQPQPRMETVYLDNHSFRSRQAPQELTTTELQLFWEKEMPLKPQRSKVPPPPNQRPTIIPAPKPVPQPVRLTPIAVPAPKPQPVRATPVAVPPPPPQPATFYVQAPQKPQTEERIIVPKDPEVSSVSVKQLMKEFDAPPIAPELRKKNYADSTFYSDPNKYYPTIEEQIEMARKVADSLQAPENLYSKGVNMFEKQRQRADKHVREGPEPERDPIAEATPEELEHMVPPAPPPPPPPPPPSFPGLQPTNTPAYPIPPPPPLLPGQPKTVQEFLEKIKVFPTSGQNDVDPQKCFDIASALYTSDSRGAKMFAKRHARAKKWDAQAVEQGDGPVRINTPVSQAAQPMMATAPGPTYQQQLKSKLTSRVPAKKAPGSSAIGPVQVNRSVAQMKPMQPQQRLEDTTMEATANYSLANSHEASPSQPLVSLAEAMPKPFGQPAVGFANSNSSVGGTLASAYGSSTTSLTSVTSDSGSRSGWRPVKFKIAAAAPTGQAKQMEHTRTDEVTPSESDELEDFRAGGELTDEVPKDGSEASETPVASDAEEDTEGGKEKGEEEEEEQKQEEEENKENGDREE